MVVDEAVQSRRLTEDDLFPLTDMLRPAAPKWKEIGGALGIANSDLTKIENHAMLDVTGYLREMLSRWLRQAPSNHPWPTIQDLVDAVRRSGHEDLAVKLQKTTEEIGDPDKKSSELSSSVQYPEQRPNPEQRPEPADNTHRGMKYYIHYIQFLVKLLPYENTENTI